MARRREKAMAKRTIEWATKRLQLVTGCTRVSAGCQRCYAARMAPRLKAMGQERYRNGFEPTAHPEVLDEIEKFKDGDLIFVCSMGDFFHEAIPNGFIQEALERMCAAKHGNFLILTKRPERARNFRRLFEEAGFPKHVWLGVSVESRDYVNRLIEAYYSFAGQNTFVSFEPLIGSPTWSVVTHAEYTEQTVLRSCKWIIAGGESGPGARVMEPAWPRALRDFAVGNNIPFMFKQWGGPHRKAAGRELDGQVWDEFPKGLKPA